MLRRQKEELWENSIIFHHTKKKLKKLKKSFKKSSKLKPKSFKILL
jgi:hypothetical protein